MPTYSYICKQCAHELEVQQAFSEEALKICPICQGELRKQFGNLGVTFKGPGFYRTDSGSNKTSGTVKGSSSSPKPSPSAAGDSP